MPRLHCPSWSPPGCVETLIQIKSVGRQMAQPGRPHVQYSINPPHSPASAVTPLGQPVWREGAAALWFPQHTCKASRRKVWPPPQDGPEHLCPTCWGQDELGWHPSRPPGQHRCPWARVGLTSVAVFSSRFPMPFPAREPEDTRMRPASGAGCQGCCPVSPGPIWPKPGRTWGKQDSSLG